jgi:hypothetical protein
MRRKLEQRNHERANCQDESNGQVPALALLESLVRLISAGWILH